MNNEITLWKTVMGDISHIIANYPKTSLSEYSSHISDGTLVHFYHDNIMRVLIGYGNTNNELIVIKYTKSTINKIPTIKIHTGDCNWYFSFSQEIQLKINDKIISTKDILHESDEDGFKRMLDPTMNKINDTYEWYLNNQNVIPSNIIYMKSTFSLEDILICITALREIVDEYNNKY